MNDTPIDGNISAFPNDPYNGPTGGMSLRDWFAGAALQGVGAWMPPSANGNLSTADAMKARALWAYEQADAMLAERQKP